MVEARREDWSVDQCPVQCRRNMTYRGKNEVRTVNVSPSISLSRPYRRQLPANAAVAASLVERRPLESCHCHAREFLSKVRSHAEKNCPVSKVLNAEITLDAKLI